jgi:hypothetical protein
LWGQGRRNPRTNAQWIFEEKIPTVLTLHFTALVHIGNDTSPFSAGAAAILEPLHTVIGNLREVAERLAPGRACISVVSDHGFAKTGPPLN